MFITIPTWNTFLDNLNYDTFYELVSITRGITLIQFKHRHLSPYFSELDDFSFPFVLSLVQVVSYFNVPSIDIYTQLQLLDGPGLKSINTQRATG